MKLNPQPLAKKCKADVPIIEKTKDIGLPLVDVLLVDVEKEEQVGIMTIRDSLSKFKKDIIKCLASHLVGWTPPSADVNRVKKRTLNGGPKLREKLKSPVKLIYFRKRIVRPTTR